MSKSSGTGGFLVLFGAMVAIVGCFVPFGRGIVEIFSIYDKLTLLVDFGRFTRDSGLLLENIFSILVFVIPFLTLLLTTTPIVTKKFSDVKLLAMVLSIAAALATLVVGYTPLMNTFSGGFAGALGGVGAGFWIILAGNAVAFLGSLDIL